MKHFLSVSAKTLTVISKYIFWLSVGLLPAAIDYTTTKFMTDKCLPFSECLIYTMPLIADVRLISLIARLLLWPLCFWFLGGKWLYSQASHNWGKSMEYDPID